MMRLLSRKDNSETINLGTPDDDAQVYFRARTCRRECLCLCSDVLVLTATVKALLTEKEDTLSLSMHL